MYAAVGPGAGDQELQARRADQEHAAIPGQAGIVRSGAAKSVRRRECGQRVRRAHASGAEAESATSQAPRQPLVSGDPLSASRLPAARSTARRPAVPGQRRRRQRRARRQRRPARPYRRRPARRRAPSVAFAGQRAARVDGHGRARGQAAVHAQRRRRRTATAPVNVFAPVRTSVPAPGLGEAAGARDDAAA